jgi:hypothetical protein
MSQTKRHLRIVAGAPATPDAQHDFEVRFSATAALAARLHRAANSFRWVGPGRLRISAQGILVTARSATLFGLRPTRRFIPAVQIQDVYREASAVQVHLRGPRHPYFRFWTEDAAGAARLVALLPTSRTIEFETVLEEPRAPRSWRRPVAWLLALLLAVTLIGLLAWLSGFLNHQPRSIGRVSPRPASSAAGLASPPPQVTPEDALRTRIDVVKYDERVQALRVEFDIAFEALMEGKVTQAAFIEQLQQWQLPQWDLLELEVRRTRAPPGSVQERADQHILATINNWQLALRSYTDDLRSGRQVADAFEYLRRADVQRGAAATMLENLGRPAAAGPRRID